MVVYSYSLDVFSSAVLGSSQGLGELPTDVVELTLEIGELTSSMGELTLLIGELEFSIGKSAISGRVLLSDVLPYLLRHSMPSKGSLGGQ